MTRALMIVTLAFSCLVTPSAWSEAAVLYGANGAAGNPSTLFILNPANGSVVSTVGPIGFAITGLAVNPLNGDLYGSTANLDSTAPGSLIKINKATGAGTLVGSFGISGHTMADLTFGQDGTLYGWAEPSRDALHTINLVTGLATRVGTATFPGNTFGSGLAASADAIVFTGRGGLGPLARVSRTTGAAVITAFLDWELNGPIAALAFGPDGLFGMGISPVTGDPTSFLLRINPGTGHVSVLGQSINFGDAIAFDPPSFPTLPAATVPIPTLSDVGFGVMVALLAVIAIHQMRRRAQS